MGHEEGKEGRIRPEDQITWVVKRSMASTRARLRAELNRSKEVTFSLTTQPTFMERDILVEGHLDYTVTTVLVQLEETLVLDKRNGVYLTISCKGSTNNTSSNLSTGSRGDKPNAIYAQRTTLKGDDLEDKHKLEWSCRFQGGHNYVGTG